MTTFGIDYKFYEAESYGKGKILGKDIDDSFLLRGVKALKRSVACIGG